MKIKKEIQQNQTVRLEARIWVSRRFLKSPGTQGQGVASAADDHLQRKLSHKPTNWQMGWRGSLPHTERKDRRILGNMAINGGHNRKQWWCSLRSRTRHLCWEVGKAQGKYSGWASQMSFSLFLPNIAKRPLMIQYRLPIGCQAASCNSQHDLLWCNNIDCKLWICR